MLGIPSKEAEYTRQLKMLLSIDLMACFVKELTADDRVHGVAILRCAANIFYPTDWNINFITRGISPPISSPFIEDALSHLRSSLDRTILHVLHPDTFKSHINSLCEVSHIGGIARVRPLFMGFVAFYVSQAGMDHLTGFVRVVQALRTLRLEQEALYEQFEQYCFRSYNEFDGRSLQEIALPLPLFFEIVRSNREFDIADVPTQECTQPNP
jgi:hypothetical protein